MGTEINIRHIKGREIAKWLPQLAALRIQVFREFPYLYEGSADYEHKYLQTYVNSKTSIAVLVLDGDQVVGASTGLALKDEDKAFVQPFADSGYDLDAIFYCAESVLLPSYRGRGLYKQFFSGREDHARALPDIGLMAFCAVQRAEDHPHRPDDYQSFDNTWRRFGYKRQEDLRTHFQWQDIDEAASSPKPMVFYTKILT